MRFETIVTYRRGRGHVEIDTRLIDDERRLPTTCVRETIDLRFGHPYFEVQPRNMGVIIRDYEWFEHLKRGQRERCIRELAKDLRQDVGFMLCDN